MSISGISAGGISDLSTLYSQRKQDFKTLETAVQSGDLSSAQTALAAWQQDMKNISAAKASSDPTSTQGVAGAASTQAGTGSQADPVKTDIDALIQAIQSGDMVSAQKDLTTLQSDVKALGGGHHHHHGASEVTQGVSKTKGNDGDADDAGDSGTSVSSNTANTDAASVYAMIGSLQNPSPLISTSA